MKRSWQKGPTQNPKPKTRLLQSILPHHNPNHALVQLQQGTQDKTATEHIERDCCRANMEIDWVECVSIVWLLFLCLLSAGSLLLVAVLLLRAQTDMQQQLLLQVASKALQVHLGPAAEEHSRHPALPARFLIVPLLSILSSPACGSSHDTARRLLEAVLSAPAVSLSTSRTHPPSPILMHTVTRADGVALHVCNVLMLRLLVLNAAADAESDARAPNRSSVDAAFVLGWMQRMGSIGLDGPVVQAKEAEDAAKGDGSLWTGHALFAVLAGFLLHLPDSEACAQAVLGSIRDYAARHPLVGTKLLPSLLHIVNTDGCPAKLQLQCLHTIPHLGTQVSLTLPTCVDAAHCSALQPSLRMYPMADNCRSRDPLPLDPDFVVRKNEV